MLLQLVLQALHVLKGAVHSQAKVRLHRVDGVAEQNHFVLVVKLGSDVPKLRQAPGRPAVEFFNLGVGDDVKECRKLALQERARLLRRAQREDVVVVGEEED